MSHQLWFRTRTKLAELPPIGRTQIRPIDAPAQTILEDPDDTHMYVNELMKASDNKQHYENLCFPTPENPGNEEEHTPI